MVEYWISFEDKVNTWNEKNSLCFSTINEQHFMKVLEARGLYGKNIKRIQYFILKWILILTKTKT